MGMPKGLAKATAYYNKLAAWADWKKLADQVTGAGCEDLVAEHRPPAGAGWRKVDKASAKLRAVFALRPKDGAEIGPAPCCSNVGRNHPGGPASGTAKPC